MTVTDDSFTGKAIDAGANATVLDLGCGDGRFVERLMANGINAKGVDLPDAEARVLARAARRPDLDLKKHICYFTDPERIPFEDNSFDLVLANNVFEHVPKLDVTVREIARVLKPTGRLYTVFPLASSIIEGHAMLPLAHKFKSDTGRTRYIRVAKRLGLYRSSTSPEDMSHYIGKHCYYRKESEILKIFESHFDVVESDAKAYIGTKGRALSESTNGARRCLAKLVRIIARFAPTVVHNYHSAAYGLSQRKAR